MAWCFQLKYLITTREGWLFIIAWRLYWMIHGLLPRHKIPSCLLRAPWFGDGLSALGGFFEPDLCCTNCNPSFGRASTRSSFFSAVQMRNIWKFSIISTSSSPSTAFLSTRPSGEHPTPALSIPLGSEVGEEELRLCPSHFMFPKLALSPDSVRFSPAQPIWTQIFHTHTDPGTLVHTVPPSLHQGIFQMPKSGHKIVLFFLLKCIFSLCKSTQGWFKRRVTSD